MKIFMDLVKATALVVGVVTLINGSDGGSLGKKMFDLIFALWMFWFAIRRD